MKKKKLWQRLGVLLLMTSVLAGSIPVNGYAAEAEAVVESSEAELIQEEILPEIPVTVSLTERLLTLCGG